MFLLDHVSISVRNLDHSRPFYEGIMAALGANKVYDRPDALGFGVRCNAAEDFHTCLAVYSSEAASADPRRHWCFKAKTREQVRNFHAAGVRNGGTCDGAPGIRAHYHEHYFGAFLLDPEGNRVEAVCHSAEESPPLEATGQSAWSDMLGILRTWSMRVTNIHERHIPVPPSQVGALLDSLASDGDALWPRTMWPAMRLDRPLGVGAIGGHGPILYSVVEFLPGQRIRFRFSGPRGFNGHHEFEVLPLGPVNACLRHTLEMKAEGLAVLSWPLIFRWLHDACIEDSLSVGQASLGIEPIVVPWSPWVKALRRMLSGGKALSQQIPGPAFQASKMPSPVPRSSRPPARH